MAEVPEQFKQNHLTLAKIKQFHSDGKYWDVQIRIDKEVFKCQRSLLAAHSKYFDTMFSSSNFEESDAKADQPITLREIDATAFEELLSFMYTGEICVKDSNVLQLLVMSDFLQLYTGLVKERCLEYVKSRSQENEPMSNALGLLCFAHLKGKSVLVDWLRAHICRHLYHYYSENAQQLMEISSEVLNALLNEFSKNYILPLPGSADILLKIVLKWINHNREGRCQYRSDLMENIDFARISPNFSRSLLNGLENVLDKVVNLHKDNKSLPELKILSMMDTNFTNSDVPSDGIIKIVVENVVLMADGQEKFSSSLTISNLSWKICFRLKSFLYFEFLLHCDGTDLCSVWNCYARATFIIKSQNEETKDYVQETGRHLFSSERKPHSLGCILYSDWDYLLDPKNGFSQNSTITFVAHVYTDVPFLKMM